MNVTIKRRILAGLCTDCGDCPPIDGKRRCAECGRVQCERVRRNVAAKKSAGYRVGWVKS